jgi:hypothetical protein
LRERYRRGAPASRPGSTRRPSPIQVLALTLVAGFGGNVRHGAVHRGGGLAALSALAASAAWAGELPASPASPPVASVETAPAVDAAEAASADPWGPRVSRREPCGALERLAHELLPAVRRGVVTVDACASVPGARIAVVLSAPSGGDPRALALGRRGQRAAKVAERWGRDHTETVVWGGAGRDDAALVSELLAPLVPLAVAPRAALGAVDVLVSGAPPTDDDPALELARRVTGVEIRVWRAADLLAAREAAAGRMLEQLPLDFDVIAGLTEAGALGLDDVAAMDAGPLAARLGLTEAAAQGVVDAAAWWSEYQAAGAAQRPRRGW